MNEFERGKLHQISDSLQSKVINLYREKYDAGLINHKKVRPLFSHMLDIKNELDHFSDTKTINLDYELRSLNMYIRSEQFSLKQSKRLEKKNEDYLNTIENMHMLVNVNGEDVLITKDNLSNYEIPQEMIRIRINRSIRHLEDLKERKNELEKLIAKENENG